MDQTLDDFIKTRKIKFPGRGGNRGQTSRGGNGNRGRGNQQYRSRGFSQGRGGARGMNRGRGGMRYQSRGQQFVARRGFNRGGAYRGYQRQQQQQQVFQSRPRRGGFYQAPRGNFNRALQGVMRGGVQKIGNRGTFGRGSMLRNRGTMLRGRGAIRQNIRAPYPPVKLYISNLDFGVNDRDIKELFSEFGPIKKLGVNFSSNGQSLGTAEVQYVNQGAAVRAIQKYNNVTLDGRPMKLELSGNANASSVRPKAMSQRLAPARNAGQGQMRGGLARGGMRGGGRGAVAKNVAAQAILKKAKMLVRKGAVGKAATRGKGKAKGAKKVAPNADQLDAELEAYTASKD